MVSPIDQIQFCKRCHSQIDYLEGVTLDGKIFYCEHCIEEMRTELGLTKGKP